MSDQLENESSFCSRFVLAANAWTTTRKCTSGVVVHKWKNYWKYTRKGCSLLSKSGDILFICFVRQTNQQIARVPACCSLKQLKTLACFRLWFPFCSPFLFQGHTKTEWRTYFPHSHLQRKLSPFFNFQPSFFEYKLEPVQGEATDMKNLAKKGEKYRESWISRMIMIIKFSDHLRVSCGEDFLSAHMKSLERRLRKQWILGENNQL